MHGVTEGFDACSKLVTLSNIFPTTVSNLFCDSISSAQDTSVKDLTGCWYLVEHGVCCGR